MTSVRTDAECPSISPDRTRVAYKTRQGNPAPGQWHIAVSTWPPDRRPCWRKPEASTTRSSGWTTRTVLYALPRAGSEATTCDIWQVPADGTGRPSVFIPLAMSPAVVRR